MDTNEDISIQFLVLLLSIPNAVSETSPSESKVMGSQPWSITLSLPPQKSEITARGTNTRRPVNGGQ